MKPPNNFPKSMNGRVAALVTGAASGMAGLDPTVAHAATISASTDHKALYSTQHSMRPKIVRNGEGETIKFLTETITSKIGADDTNGGFALAEALMTPGEGPMPHIHRDEDELFIILEGEVTMLVGNGRYAARPGDAFFGPRGTVHRFGNNTDLPGRLIVVVAPPRFVEMFGRVLAPEKPDETMPDVIARALRLAPQYGLTLLPDHPLPPTVSAVPAAKEHFSVGDHRISVLIDAGTSDGVVTVHRIAWPKKRLGLPVHIHDGTDELLIVIDHQFEVIIGETSSILRPGDIAFVPRGTAHTICPVADGFGLVISIHMPAGGETSLYEWDR